MFWLISWLYTNVYATVPIVWYFGFSFYYWDNDICETYLAQRYMLYGVTKYLLKMKLNNTCLNLARTTTSVSIITFVDISVRIYHVRFIVASDIINSN
jgi:hypothetical protein